MMRRLASFAASVLLALAATMLGLFAFVLVSWVTDGCRPRPATGPGVHR